MHIALFDRGRLPVPTTADSANGGLSRARAGRGGPPGVADRRAGVGVPGAQLVPVETETARRPDFSIEPHLPPGMDLLLSFVEIGRPPAAPWIHRLAGNRRPGQGGPPNTIYVSENHARRHGGRAWVHNGLDPADFRFRREKDDYDLFLGRLHRAKGYRWAVEGARAKPQATAPGWRLAAEPQSVCALRGKGGR